MNNKHFVAYIAIIFAAISAGILGYWYEGAQIDKAVGQEPTLLVPKSAEDIMASGKHFGQYLDGSVVEAMFTSAPVFTTPNSPVASVVIPHHDVAGSYAAGVLKSLQYRPTDVVVIIGPNHRSLGYGCFQSEVLSWQTPQGEVEVNKKIVNALVQAKVLTVEESTFDGEQSIAAVVPLVQKVWPNMQVVAIAVKPGEICAGQVDKFATKLAETLSENALVISSVDFSHYLSSNYASFHDDLSLAVLAEGDTVRAKRIEVDSPNTLATILRYNELNGSQTFSLAARTDSNEILKQSRDLPGTTHVSGYFSMGKPVESKTITIQFFGDMMLDRNVAKVMSTSGLDYVLSKMRGEEYRYFYGADLLVANLEGPFAATRIDTTKSIAFRFDPKLILDLKRYNFSAFSLANNHLYDMGKANEQYTRDLLKDNGFGYFGNQIKEDAEYMWVANNDNTPGLPEPVVFIGINNTDHVLNMTKVAEAIASAKKISRYVFVVPHWGVEYKTESRTAERALARRLIDLGVTAVIGGHPHVVQEMEIYKGKPIFYSLGNFIFDQYFSKETQEGLSVGLVLEGGKVKTTYVFPFYSVKSSNQWMSGSRLETWMEWWNKSSRLEGGEFKNNKLETK